MRNTGFDKGLRETMFEDRNRLLLSLTENGALALQYAARAHDQTMSQSGTISERPAVTVTERAARRIAEIVAGEPGTPLLRVSVEGGGCSGFSYKFGLVAASEPDD